MTIQKMILKDDEDSDLEADNDVIYRSSDSDSSEDDSD